MTVPPAGSPPTAPSAAVTLPVEAGGPPLRIVLVDDEPLARLRLHQLLAARPGEAVLAEVVGEAGDAAALQRALQAAAGCDLVLLDIALPGADGLAVAEALRRLPQPPAVVFVTAHGGHALQAFELEAVDYLTKPVRRERLLQALARVQRRLQGQAAAAAQPEPGPVLVASSRGRMLRLPVAELLYLRAEHKAVQVVSSRGEWTLDEVLTDLEQRLGAAVLRVHRNALVAVAAVRALERGAAGDGGDASDGSDGWVVRLANGEALAVSRRQLGAVREALARQAPG